MFFDFESHVRPDRAVEQLGANRALDQRLEIFRADVWRSLGLVVLAMGGLLALVHFRRKESNPRIAQGIVAFLAVVTLMEMQAVDRRYQPEDKGWVRNVDFHYPLTPSPADEAILAERLRMNPELQ